MGRAASIPGDWSRPTAPLLWTVTLVLAGLRVLFAVQTELLPEEAYYWNYAQHPALGYFDHPPMVAWTIALGTALAGNTELGVRLVNIMLAAASGWLVFLIGRLWFTEVVAVWAALIFNAVPLFAGIAFVVTPDGPLVFFWLLTLYAVSRALQAEPLFYPLTGRRGSLRALVAGPTGHWLLAGIAFGAALLSKYTAVLLAPSLLLLLAVSPQFRPWLRRPQPWMALTVALVVFSPVIVWNAQHDWASFAFQSTRTADLARRNAAWDALVFWLYQVGITTPLVFALLAAAVARGIRSGWWHGQANWSFAVTFALPLFLFFVYVGFKTQVHVNWTAPAFLSLTVAAGAILAENVGHASPRRAHLWRWAAGVTAVLCSGVILLGHTAIAWGVPRVFAYTHAGGWRALAKIVEAAESELEAQTGRHPFVIGVDKYNLAAELNFYSSDPGEHLNTMVLGEQGLGFRYWADLRSFEGRDAVAVLVKPKESQLAKLRAQFSQVSSPRRVEIRSHGRNNRVVYLVFCRDYQARPS